MEETRLTELQHGIFAVCVVAVACAGCALPTPQENLRDTLQGCIGRQVDPGYTFLERQPLSKTLLPNGNLQLTYRYMRRCTFVVEILESRTIVAALSEGPSEDCILPP